MTIVTVVAIVNAFCPYAIRLASGQAPVEAVQWLTGRDLDRKNRLAVSASWTDAPLRSRLTAFAKQQKTGIFLDRRIDPSQLINISIARGTPEQFLWNVAEQRGLGICRIEDFYFFGPPETAAVLPHLWKPMKAASSKLRRTSQVKWTERKPMQFASAIQPKQLLSDLAKENQFTITNPNDLPHDVWSGFEIPPMSLDGRVAILLVGFGKWYERSADGSQITIVNFTEPAVGQFDIRDLTDAKQTSRELKAKFPDLRISTSRSSIKATGPPIQLAELRRIVVKMQKAVVGDNTLTLTTKAPRKAILLEVAKMIGKDFSCTPDSESTLTEQVAVNVKNVTVHELIQEILNGSNLKFDINANQLRISQK